MSGTLDIRCKTHKMLLSWNSFWSCVKTHMLRAQNQAPSSGILADVLEESQLSRVTIVANYEVYLHTFMGIKSKYRGNQHADWGEMLNLYTFTFQTKRCTAAPSSCHQGFIGRIWETVCVKILFFVLLSLCCCHVISGAKRTVQLSSCSYNMWETQSHGAMLLTHLLGFYAVVVTFTIKFQLPARYNENQWMIAVLMSCKIATPEGSYAERRGVTRTFVRGVLGVGCWDRISRKFEVVYYYVTSPALMTCLMTCCRQ